MVIEIMSEKRDIEVVDDSKSIGLSSKQESYLMDILTRAEMGNVRREDLLALSKMSKSDDMDTINLLMNYITLKTLSASSEDLDVQKRLELAQRDLMLRLKKADIEDKRKFKYKQSEDIDNKIDIRTINALSRKMTHEEYKKRFGIGGSRVHGEPQNIKQVQSEYESVDIDVAEGRND